MTLYKKIDTQVNLFKNSFYISKTLKLIEEENYKSANKIINKVNTLFIKKGNYKFYLCKGFLLFKLKEYNNSVLLFKKAILELEIFYKLNKINIDEYNYLKNYSYLYILFVAYILEEHYEFKLIKIKIKELTYSLNKVDNSIINAYPLNKKIKGSGHELLL